jgi:hypothetical protein
VPLALACLRGSYAPTGCCSCTHPPVLGTAYAGTARPAAASNMLARWQRMPPCCWPARKAPALPRLGVAAAQPCMLTTITHASRRRLDAAAPRRPRYPPALAAGARGCGQPSTLAPRAAAAASSLQTQATPPAARGAGDGGRGRGWARMRPAAAASAAARCCCAPGAPAARTCSAALLTITAARPRADRA